MIATVLDKQISYCSNYLLWCESIRIPKLQKINKKCKPLWKAAQKMRKFSWKEKEISVNKLWSRRPCSKTNCWNWETYSVSFLEEALYKCSIWISWIWSLNSTGNRPHFVYRCKFTESVASQATPDTNAGRVYRWKVVPNLYDYVTETWKHSISFTYNYGLIFWV